MYTIHLLISGNVQGVFYRAAAKQRADKIGITGWIKNTTDNKVGRLLLRARSHNLQLLLNGAAKAPNLPAWRV